MQATPFETDYRPTTAPQGGAHHAHSGVMWAPILAGALAIMVVALILSFVAGALGFASLSPWGGTTAGMGKTFAISGAVALIVIQWVSAGFGGYLTGRMRTEYVAAHTHEIFFRDTVHGFLSWSLATLVGVILLGSAAMHKHDMSGGYGNQGATHAPATYFIDRLFMTPEHDVTLSDGDRAEVSNILAMEAVNGTLPSEDKDDLIQLVSARTHLSADQAASRVDKILAQEESTMESARKYMSLASLFLVFSLLIGAFIASVAGGLGGQHRDLHYTTGKLSE